MTASSPFKGDALMAREYFQAYHSYIEAMEPLNDAERGRLFTACLIYSMTGEVQKLSGNERFVFPGMKSQIDRDNENYAKKCEVNRQNGALGGKRSLPNGTERPPSAPPTVPNAPRTPPKEKAKAKAKAKAKEKTGDFCAEPQASSAPPVRCIPLNTGEEYPIYQPQVDEWQGLYPAVNVMQELRNMRGWCLGNKQRCKTKSGVLRFITGWLAKEQNRGGAMPQRQTGGDYGPAERVSFAELAGRLEEDGKA